MRQPTLRNLQKAENQAKKTDAIVDEAIEAYDDLIAKANARNVENKKAHFKQINKELETKARNLIEKINSL